MEKGKAGSEWGISTEAAGLLPVGRKHTRKTKSERPNRPGFRMLRPAGSTYPVGPSSRSAEMNAPDRNAPDGTAEQADTRVEIWMRASQTAPCPDPSDHGQVLTDEGYACTRCGGRVDWNLR